MTANVVIGILAVLLVLGFGPAVRGVAFGLDPHRRQSQRRTNSDMVRLLVLLVLAFAVMFAWKLGGAL